MFTTLVKDGRCAIANVGENDIVITKKTLLLSHNLDLYIIVYFVQCSECDDLRRRLENLEALTEKQADLIRRLLPLETEIDELKSLNHRLNKRIVLGNYVFVLETFLELKTFHDSKSTV